jgi:Domain of unknown function (DUF4412)
MKRLIALIALLIALPSSAGITFTAKTISTEGGDVTVRALVSGSRAKVTFLQSGSNIAATGDYMLSLDQGTTLYLISPGTRTYTRYDTRTMMSGMGQMVQGLRGTMKVTFESPNVEKVLEEDGGLIAGQPTRHYRYRTSYVVSIHAVGDKKATTEIEEDIWTTTSLSDPALAIWLKKDPAPTGDPQLDAMIKAEMDKVQGFPLRRITITHMHDVNGAEHNSRVEMQVTTIKRTPIAASEFVIPKTYKRVPDKRLFEQE